MLPTRASIRVFERGEKEMPCHEEHCQHSLKRYGIRADDIHTWIDQPSKKWQGSHRQFRHDTEAVTLAGDVFGKKYGRELAQNIALDHIMVDHEEEIKQKNESILMKCANCGGQLVERNGKLKCQYCGYEMRTPVPAQHAFESAKLPAKTIKCMMYRRHSKENETVVLPKALPPIDLMADGTIIDEAYREFSDKNEVWWKLRSLGYVALSVRDLRRLYNMTDSEIKELLYESKKVTVGQLRDILRYAGYSGLVNPADFEPYPTPKRYVAFCMFMWILAIPFAIWAVIIDRDLEGSGVVYVVIFVIFLITGFGPLFYFGKERRADGIVIKGKVYRRRSLETPEWMRKRTADSSENQEHADNEPNQNEFAEESETQIDL